MSTRHRRPPPGGPRRRASRGERGSHLSQFAIAAALLVGAVALVAVAVSGRGSSGGSGSANELALSEGVEAPAVVLPATTGDTVDVSAFRGKRDVLLYFYEHAG